MGSPLPITALLRLNSCLDHLSLKCVNKSTIIKLETPITDHITVIANLKFTIFNKPMTHYVTISDHKAIVRDIICQQY